MKPDYHAFILIQSFKIVQIKIQKGQSKRNEMKPIIMLLYSFVWKLQTKSKSKYKKDKV